MLNNHGIIHLPRPLNRRLDRFAASLLYQQDHSTDFSSPEGEEALVPPSSVSWIIFKNPVSLFIGGITAVLLEFADPKVRDGVWDHSNFRTAPLMRLRRTGLAAMMTVYGPKSAAETMIAHVVRMHERVRGVTSEGSDYHANDPALLDWVQATATFGFMEAYHTYAAPLDIEQRDRLIDEAKISARLYGATGAPSSQSEMDRMIADKAAQLMPSPIILEFLEIMATVDVMPGPGRRLTRPLLKAAVALLPNDLRHKIGLQTPEWALKPWERHMINAAAGASDRIVLPSSPPVQACRRLGLPADYLFRKDRRAAMPIPVRQ